MSKLNPIALGAAAIGGVFVYSGLSGYSVLKAVQNVLVGQPPKAGQSAALLATGGGGSGNSGGSGAQGGSRSANLKIGKRVAAEFGWGSGAEWSALVSLWDSESGWNNKIWNTTASCAPGCYAYGIAQACSHGEHKDTGHGRLVGPYPSGNAGNPSEYGGTSNAEAQIRWGLDYIKTNYQSPTHVPHGGY